MSESLHFDDWWKGSPLIQNADSGSFSHWWKGAPIVQKARSLIQETIVGSGGLTLGGHATVATNTPPQLSYGGLTLGGSAAVAVTYSTTITGIFVESYVGDGTGARTITGPIIGYTPIAVMVMGRDGSNNEIGAMRIEGDSAGKSHPWAADVAAGSSTRSNRITGFVAGGFTVGTDLNVSGVPYIYILFPHVAGFCEAGSYVGSGANATSAIFVSTDVGLGTFTAFGSVFNATSVGRSLYRPSNGSYIGTITSVTDSSHAHGTVVQNLSGELDWAFDGRQIPIGFDPDFVFLQCTDTTGTTKGPLPLIPSVSSYGGAQLIGFATTNIDFGTGSINPGLVSCVPGSNELRVLNTTADFPATSGYDANGITYLWLAVKADPIRVTMDKKIYTGSGTSSRDLSPIVFTPQFVMLFTEAGGGRPLPGFKDLDADVTTTTHTFPFADGIGASTPQLSFLVDGIHLIDNAYNNTGITSAAFFLRGVASAATTGGLRLGGSAEVVYKPSGGAITYNHEATGGLQTNGEALIEASLSGLLIMRASGGLILGGASGLDVVFAWPGSGGFILSGTGSGTLTPATPTITPTPGGSGAGRFFPEPGRYRVPTTFRWCSRGVLWVFGHAETYRTFATVTSGGVTVEAPLNRVLAYMRHEYAPPVGMAVAVVSGKARTRFESAIAARREEDDTELLLLGLV